ncbi:MAG: hypothetical protein HYZ40_02475 [Rhodospirillales bacterium]|nr:hypothetical protein [Rhodospirillales bacterium]
MAITSAFTRPAPASASPALWDVPAFAAEQRRLTVGLLACARQRGLETIDSFDVLSRHAGNNGPRGLYVQWHMNAEGNRLIANMVAADLARPYIPPSR